MTNPGTSLHIAGRADLLKVERAVGIVGSRAASRAGREKAFALARELAGSGWLVVSGGALGIDSAAHEGAMAAGAPTVAIVAGGVTRPYPERNAPLFQAILSGGGAIASPFADGEGIRRWHFVARNKVLAGLVRAVVVVEAGARSGARHTAAAARLVGACPGSAGTESLLMDGAALVESAADLEAALQGSARRPAVVLPPAGTDAQRTLAALGGEPRTAAQVAAATGLSVIRAIQGLCALELEGLVRAAPGGAYLRVANGS